MKTGIFLLSFCAGTAIVLLSLISLASGRFQFWPPPRTDSWQYRTFWMLFRVLVAGVVVLSVMDFEGLGPQNAAVRYFIGIPLAVLGFSLAFYASFYLGWKNAHGEKQSLETDGLYGWSRNPVYVVSVLGFIGLGIAIHSALVYSLLAIWTLLYLIAPFLEEPWLEREYGEAFALYKARVPRFVGWVRRRT